MIAKLQSGTAVVLRTGLFFVQLALACDRLAWDIMLNERRGE